MIAKFKLSLLLLIRFVLLGVVITIGYAVLRAAGAIDAAIALQYYGSFANCIGDALFYSVQNSRYRTEAERLSRSLMAAVRRAIRRCTGAQQEPQLRVQFRSRSMIELNMNGTRLLVNPKQHFAFRLNGDVRTTDTPSFAERAVSVTLKYL